MPTDVELDAALNQGIAFLHSHGITAIHDQRMMDQEDGPRMIAAYRRLRERKENVLFVLRSLLGG